MIAPTVRDFTITDGTLKYHGVGGLFQFVGSIDMSSQKVADITIALFINDAESAQKVVRSFTSANKRGSTSSNGIFQINTNDEFEVRMKGDGTTGLTVDIFSLNLTFMEV